ncbi:MAG: T9SS type A sorting domain-containing protein [Chitinophagales bacterium]|nr:T9SS type A sorting domain-containing protein [Chitinophagales bacterium]
MKHRWFILPAMLYGIALHGQTLQRPTFSNVGNNNAALTFTVGESIAYYAAVNPSGSLSIGAQPGERKTGVDTDDPDLLRKIELFPNPTDGLLTLQIIDSDTDPFQVTLYNTLGQKLSEQRMGSGTHVVDLCNQAAGSFFLLFTRGDKQAQFTIIKH